LTVVMRRLDRWSRLFAALFAVWFAVVIGDPGVLHSCAMHGTGHGSHGSASATATHGAHAGQAAMAGHHADGPAPHQPAPCSCVGHCCAAPAVVTLPVADALELPAVAQVCAEPIPPAVSDAPASPALRLPFANGPPAV
jgi:hypothetical protein